MYPHRIRLRGPWEWEADDKGRVTMPCRWSDLGLGEGVRRVRFHRRFGLPRKLDPHERVWLTFTEAGGVTGIWLNEHPLERSNRAEASFEFEVTELLAARNHLQVEAEGTIGDDPVWDEVALEIRCTAYLRDMHVWPEQTEAGPCLHAAGTVVGASKQPLEVYVLCANRTVAYAPVTAGRPFEVISDPLGDLQGDIRVELVCGAVVWYTVEIPPLHV